MAKEKSMVDLGIKGLIGLLAGVVCGFILMYLGGKETPWIAQLLVYLDCLGQIFLRLLKMIVVPLVFCCITNAIIGLGEIALLRSLGLKTFAYFFCTSCIFSFIGVMVTKLLKPGAAFTLEQFKNASFDGSSANFINAIIDFFPDNIVKAAANTSLLQIIVFCAFFGAAVLSLGERGKTVANMLKETELAMFKIIGYVMILLPYGVFCLITYALAFYGPSVIGGLLIFIACDWITVIIGIFTVHLLLLTFVGKVNFFKFIANFKAALVVAVAGCSSTATLPIATAIAKERIGVPAKIADFVIPLGSTANMNGTAGFFSIITVFTCQLMGVDLSIPQYVLLIVESCLLAISCSTVPNTGIVIAITVLQSFGLPIEAIGLIVGVYKFCDMCHTPTNCLGDWVTATCIASSDGVLDREVCVCSLGDGATAERS